MKFPKGVILAVCSIAIIFAGVGGFLAQKFCNDDYLKAVSYNQPVTLIIQPGQPLRQIGAQLEEARVIDSSWAFYLNLVVRRIAGQLKAGEYAFPENRNLKSVIAKLLKGEVVQHKLTIPEGMTTKEVHALLLKDDKLKGDLPDHRQEGSLLPETYHYTRGEERKALIQRMQRGLDTVLREQWEKHKEISQLRSPQEVMILASIVEKETALSHERPRIAAVFLNRLRQGMPLQACPTVTYGIEQLTGRTFIGALRHEDLNLNTPYNTYLNKGLPPQPICNPGKAAIMAVLNPLPSKDLYFVADGSGGHAFAQTLEEHQKNHAQWRKIRAAIKEMDAVR